MISVASGYYNAVTDFAVPDDGSDALPGLINAKAQLPLGSTLVIPPPPRGGFYGLSGPFVVDRAIRVKGLLTISKVGGIGTPYGTIFRPLNAAAQKALGAAGLIQATDHGAKLEGIAARGFGVGNGAFGFQALMASNHQIHETLFADGFDSGFAFGSGADHVRLKESLLSGNRYGYRIQAGNQNDPSLVKVDLTGNTRASLYLEPSVSVTNTLLDNCHLGFGPIGIEQDAATDPNHGFDQLTLIATPIESVSQHMSLPGACGGIRVTGGYWIWKDQPANPAMACNRVTYGPISLDCEFTNANPNAPSVVHVSGYSNYPTRLSQKVGGFAQKETSGNVMVG